MLIEIYSVWMEALPDLKSSPTINASRCSASSITPGINVF